MEVEFSIRFGKFKSCTSGIPGIPGISCTPCTPCTSCTIRFGKFDKSGNKPGNKSGSSGNRSGRLGRSGNRCSSGRVEPGLGPEMEPFSILAAVVLVLVLDVVAGFSKEGERARSAWARDPVLPALLVSSLRRVNLEYQGEGEGDGDDDEVDDVDKSCRGFVTLLVDLDFECVAFAPAFARVLLILLLLLSTLSVLLLLLLLWGGRSIGGCGGVDEVPDAAVADAETAGAVTADDVDDDDDE